MIKFKVNRTSQFRLNTGEWCEAGNWQPTNFMYHDTIEEGRLHRWLIVSFNSQVDVYIRGRLYHLVLGPVECDIKGMEALQEACTAVKLYKVGV